MSGICLKVCIRLQLSNDPLRSVLCHRTVVGNEVTRPEMCPPQLLPIRLIAECAVH